MATRTPRVSADDLLAEARAEIDRLSPAEALEAQHGGAWVIDVRSELNRERNGIVPGSVHVPRTVFEWRLDPTSRWRNPHLTSEPAQLIVLCDIGWSSSLAAYNLRRLGHDRVADVIGGFAAWQAAGLPVIAAPRDAERAGVNPGMAPADGEVGSLETAVDQRSRWDEALRERADRYGADASAPALATLDILREIGAHDILELGGGQGRDTVYLAAAGLHVTAVDFSPTAVSTITAKADAADLGELVTTIECDVREPLPFADESFDACYSHMLFCMALGEHELRRLTAELRRVLRPGGLCVYTARTTDDPDFARGTRLGRRMFELDGFVVHFFDRELVAYIAEGFDVVEIEDFEEGALPRHLMRVTMRRS